MWRNAWATSTSPVPDRMDFSARFPSPPGQWHTFDARRNKLRIGRIVMARGRDASDVALATSFGPTKLQKFVVRTDEATDASETTKAA